MTPNRAIFAALIALAAGGCAWEPETEPSPAPVAIPANQSVSSLDEVLLTAQRQIGVPYLFGGQSPGGFDCSGLVHYAYGRIGVRTPRTTSELWKKLTPIAAGAIEPGDVLFFDIDGKPSHVGLYLGEGRFVHAPATGREVSMERLSAPFYNRRFLRAGRVVTDFRAN